MMATNDTTADIQILTLLVDSKDEDESEYRFLINGKDVKYVTVDPGVFPKDDRNFAPILEPSTGRPVFSRTTNHVLPGVESTWHPTRIDHLELKKLDRLRQNIHLVTHPLFNRPVIVKFAEFPWQIPYYEAETTAYEWIDGAGVSPKFLGHLTEAGRVIGFILENIDGARTAGPEDLKACQAALTRLHSLDIKHGDINKHNFLVRDGKAVLVDFETARKSGDRGELEAEYLRLEESLRDPSYRGGVGIPETNEHILPE
ncbi:hypothetical protein GQX73_g1006 [Xylaria multiplex]|uniref:Aminoglycoside phosphotransferase domain-containing protein n=1 Tax=Xylaria multiplex TaxID=323545 RepID=A0A7C8J1F0_9PEZI|nr:hypothetical protein GQX73_g1006 [Xylaria multiplex]